MAPRTFRLSNSLDSITELAALVESFAEEEGLPAAATMQLQLVIEEAAANVIQHAFPAGAEAGEVALARDGDLVTIEIADDGPEFDPLTVAPPDIDKPLSERELGGLGIEMMRQMTDRQTYRREGGRNRLRLEKRIVAA